MNGSSIGCTASAAKCSNRSPTTGRRSFWSSPVARESPRRRIRRLMTALRYRAVLFDLDGTLVDSYDALAGAVNYARREEGLPALPNETIKQFVGEGLERLLQRAFERESIPQSIIESFQSRYDEICCEGSRVLDDVETTLADLSAAGVMMAVCTNKPTSFSKKILDFL